MTTKKKLYGEPVTDDPDDPPMLLDAWFEEAHVYEGDKLIKKGRGRGRPRSLVAKEHVSLRLDPDVMAALRAEGTGWQTRINDILRAALLLDGPQRPRVQPKRQAARKFAAAKRAVRA